ncbi:unnamed protein product [Tuber aestivum]|uniref:Uncharacterized protein n=1 Tax=Tuber aestivum TaxID=59557 RepID=A0A292PTA3_9PEZI|nr:unnamed protein product [Tuber aestivum]
MCQSRVTNPPPAPRQSPYCGCAFESGYGLFLAVWCRWLVFGGFGGIVVSTSSKAYNLSTSSGAPSTQIRKLVPESLVAYSMFEDHWYHSSSQPEFSSLRRQESQRNSRKVAEERKTPPGPPEADTPRRPKSYTNLRCLGWQVDTSLVPGGNQEVSNDIAEELPPRPKSRNDLDDLKAERYGRGKGLKACGRGRRAAKKTKELKDELDFADWYGEFEGDLEDANSEHK